MWAGLRPHLISHCRWRWSGSVSQSRPQCPPTHPCVLPIFHGPFSLHPSPPSPPTVSLPTTPTLAITFYRPQPTLPFTLPSAVLYPYPIPSYPSHVFDIQSHPTINTLPYNLYLMLPCHSTLTPSTFSIFHSIFSLFLSIHTH